jgi:hypothetical protein
MALASTIGALEPARASALNARHPHEPKEGGAALQWSPEERRRRWPRPVLAGTRRPVATGHGRAITGYQEDYQLTTVATSLTVRRAEAGNAGERRRPAAQHRPICAKELGLEEENASAEDGGDEATRRRT